MIPLSRQLNSLANLIIKNTQYLSQVHVHEDKMVELLMNSHIGLEQFLKLYESRNFLTELEIDTVNLKLLQSFQGLTKNIYRWFQTNSFQNKNSGAKNSLQNLISGNAEQNRCDYCKNYLSAIKIRNVKEEILGKQANSLQHRINNPDSICYDEEYDDEDRNFWDDIEKNEFEQRKNGLYPKAESYIMHIVEQEKLKHKRYEEQFMKIEKVTSQLGTLAELGAKDISDNKIDQIFAHFLNNIQKLLGRKSIVGKIQKICETLIKMVAPKTEAFTGPTEGNQPKKQRPQSSPQKDPSSDYRIIPKPIEAIQNEIMYGRREEVHVPAKKKAQLKRSQIELEIKQEKRQTIREAQNEQKSESEHSYEGNYRYGESEGDRGIRSSLNKSSLNLQRFKESNKKKLVKVKKNRQKVFIEQLIEEKKKQFREEGVQCCIDIEIKVHEPLHSKNKSNKKNEHFKSNKNFNKLKSPSIQNHHSKLKTSSIIKHKENLQKSKKLVHQSKSSSDFHEISKISRSPFGQSAKISQHSLKSKHRNSELKAHSNSVVPSLSQQQIENKSIKSKNMCSIKEIQYEENNRQQEQGEMELKIEQSKKLKKHYIRNLVKTSGEQSSRSKFKMGNGSFEEPKLTIKETKLQKKLHHLVKLKSIQKQNAPFNSGHLSIKSLKNVKCQNYFSLSDLQIFGGLNEAYDHENLWRNQPQTENSPTSNNLSVSQILSQIQNISKFKSNLYIATVSFLICPYTTVTQQTVADDVSRLSNQNIDRKLRGSVESLVEKHKKECGEINCIHIKLFAQKILL